MRIVCNVRSADLSDNNYFRAHHHRTPPGAVKRRDDLGRRHCFEIITPSRNYVLQASVLSWGGEGVICPIFFCAAFRPPTFFTYLFCFCGFAQAADSDEVDDWINTIQRATLYLLGDQKGFFFVFVFLLYVVWVAVFISILPVLPFEGLCLKI